MSQESTPSVAATVGLSRKIGAAVAAFAALGAGTAGAQTVVYVDDDAPAWGDGQSWETAHQTIHEALDLLSGSTPFQEVRIAQGRYFATDLTFGASLDSLVLLSGVSLLGGFRGAFGGPGSPNERDPDRFVSVLDGDIGVRGFAGDDTTTGVVVAAGASASIDGLHFENIDLTAIDGSYSRQTTVRRCVFRPGLHSPRFCIGQVPGVSVVVEDCVFYGQATDYSLIWVSGAEVIVRGCEFIGNVAESSIVRAYSSPSVAIEGCRFESNDAWRGVIRAVSADLVQVRNTTVGGSIGTAPWGGFPPIAIETTGWLVLDRVNVRDNRSAPSCGGGLWLDDVGNAMIIDSRFTGNFAPDHGGAIDVGAVQNLILINCLIADNLAGGKGAGIRTFGNTSLLNCTIVNNQSGQPAGAGIAGESDDTGVFSSIVWGNRQTGQPATGATLNSQMAPVSLVLVWDSLVAGINGGYRNLAVDPRFAGPGDYHLQPDSPAINFARNEAAAPLNGERDLDGFPRVVGGFVDAGCYERQGLPARCGPADLGGTAVRGLPGYRIPDGVVNSNDFFVFLDAWMANDAAADLSTTSIPGTPGYLVPNGIVGNEDFFVFLGLYQQGC